MGQWNDIDQLEKGTRHGMPRPPRETGHVSVEASQFRFEMFMSVRLCEEVLCQRFGLRSGELEFGMEFLEFG